MNPEEWTIDQHLLWSFFQNQEIIASIGKWPLWAQQQILKPHKTNPERFALMKFFIWNGVDPVVASEWTRSMTTKKYGSGRRLVVGEYDAAALRDFAMIIHKSREGILFGKGARIYDLIEGRPIIT